MEVLPIPGKGRHCRSMIDDDRGKGVVVNTQDLRATKPISRRDGISHPHGEVIANAECGEAK